MSFGLFDYARCDICDRPVTGAIERRGPLVGHRRCLGGAALPKRAKADGPDADQLADAILARIGLR
jgi:hypothetical protein